MICELALTPLLLCAVLRCAVLRCSNALKFTNEGSITVKVADEPEGMIAISVADTGVGIPAEFRDKLFHTIGLTTTNEEFLGGSGLGLCICK
jgi:signal transduction histidine kinase